MSLTVHSSCYRSRPAAAPKIALAYTFSPISTSQTPPADVVPALAVAASMFDFPSDAVSPTLAAAFPDLGMFFSQAADAVVIPILVFVSLHPAAALQDLAVALSTISHACLPRYLAAAVFPDHPALVLCQVVFVHALAASVFPTLRDSVSAKFLARVVALFLPAVACRSRIAHAVAALLSSDARTVLAAVSPDPAVVAFLALIA